MTFLYRLKILALINQKIVLFHTLTLIYTAIQSCQSVNHTWFCYYRNLIDLNVIIFSYSKSTVSK